MGLEGSMARDQVYKLARRVDKMEAEIMAALARLTERINELQLDSLIRQMKKAETPEESRPKVEQYQRYPDGSVGDWYG